MTSKQKAIAEARDLGLNVDENDTEAKIREAIAAELTGGDGGGETNGTKTGGVTLSDLTPEAKIALMLELEREKETVAAAKVSDAERAAAVRDRALGSLMHDRDHLRDCPGGRVEGYEATRPAQPSKGIAAAPVSVIRCVECGGSTVIEQPWPATLAGIDQRAAEIAAEIETSEVPS